MKKKHLILYFNEEKGRKCNRIIEKKGKNYKKTPFFINSMEPQVYDILFIFFFQKKIVMKLS